MGEKIIVNGETARAIHDLYAIVGRLEALYPGRRFTPDGHMVGSLGEAVAAERYGIVLFEPSYPVHDGRAPDGRLVQIKATQGDRIGINEEPECIIVLRMERDGSFEEVFNGPGSAVWNAAGKVQKTGQRPISVSKLRCMLADELIRRNEQRDGAKTLVFEGFVLEALSGSL